LDFDSALSVRPANFSWEAVEGAATAYKRLKENIIGLGNETGTPDKKYLDQFKEYVNDDLDTPKAIALMWDLLKDSSIENKNKKETLFEFDKVLGLHLSILHHCLLIIPAEVQKLVTSRNTAQEKQRL
jgi:cysteinyl-tRNA synthetase